MRANVRGSDSLHARNNSGHEGSDWEPIVVSPYFARKAWVMRVIGGILLVVAAPLILLLVVVVRLTSRGPGLYSQERMGRHGRTFKVYKLRSMFHGAEEATGPIWCQPNDSRITPIGRVIRALHWDELPQLIGVALGDMDLVGPRPERPEIVDELVEHVPDFCERLAVLPGITGLAQVNQPPDATYECTKRKLYFDLEYIQTASLGLDLRLMICSALRMVGIRHGHAAKWLGLTREVPTDYARPSVPNRRGKRLASAAVTAAAEVAEQFQLNGSGRPHADAGVHKSNGAHPLDQVGEYAAAVALPRPR